MDDITLDATNAESFLRSTVERAIKNRWLNPWCGICNSRDLRYEDAPTKFLTLAEAMPRIRELEAEQALARSVFGQPSHN